MGIAFFSISVLISFGLTSNQAFAGVTETCEEGFTWVNGKGCVRIEAVGGLAVPVSESQLYGELATQYSLWLIPTLSAVGIGAYIIKRKLPQIMGWA